MMRMTMPAKLKQADVARVLREARKQGAPRVDFAPDGSIQVWLKGDPQPIGEAPAPPEPAERETIIGKPDSKGKKIVL